MVGQGAGSVLRFLVATVLTVVGFAVTPAAATSASVAPATPPAVDTGTWYVLVNQSSGKALDVATKGTPSDENLKVTSTANGAQATTYTRDGTASQQWEFVDAGNGSYELRNRYSGKVLGVPGSSKTDGTVLTQSSHTGGTNQKFRVKESPGGAIRLINGHSDKAVSGGTSSFVDGTKVVQSKDANAPHQRWVLVPASVVDSDVWFMLVNENSGKALDVLADDPATPDTNEAKLDGRTLIQSTAESKTTQQWQLAETGNGYYRLRNRTSDKVLEVPASSTADGTVLAQRSDSGGSHQQFQLTASGDGVFRLVMRHSGKVVSVEDSSTADGAEIVQSMDANAAHQKWRLVPAQTSSWYVLVNENGGKALDVINGATTDGAKVVLTTRTDESRQQWKVLDAGNGYYKLLNRRSGKVLDVPASSTAEGTVLDQSGDRHGANQQFRMGVSAEGSVRLLNRQSGKAVSASSAANGADVVQSADLDGASQRWRLLPVDTARPVTVDAEAWYTLVNRNSGKALDVAADATTDGAPVTQTTRDDLAPQQWQFVASGDGYYRLRNRNSGKVLDVPSSSTADGAVLQQSSDTGAASQQFRLAVSPDGLVRLVNRNSGKPITAVGTDVVQSTDLNSAGQKWMLVPVDTKATTTVNTQLWYVLVNRHSGKALDNYGLNLYSGARVAQYTRNDGYWQQWQFVPSSDGFYRLRNRHSNKVVNVSRNSTENGGEIIQWDDVDTPNEQFRIADAGDGYVELVNRNSGKIISVLGWSSDDGAHLVQWDDLDGANQQWQLIPVGGSAAYPRPEPVFGVTETHDPTVVKKPDGTYLMSATILGLFTSDDRVTWTPAGEVFPDGSPAWTDAYTNPDSHMLWAPDLTYHDGTYYMYYSASNAGSKKSAIGLATSATGEAGSWVDHGKVLESSSTSDFNAIDPNLIIDDDGRWWLSYGSYASGIRMVEIDPATGMKLNDTEYDIASRNGNGTIEPANDWYGRVEAPFIVKRGAYYYLYVSFDGCCAVGRDATYRVMVGRSTSPTGPYVDKNGSDMLDGGGTEILASQDGALYGPGHQAVLSDTDGDILFYHYYAANKDGSKGCNYCQFGINHIGYDNQNWPYIY